MAVQTDDRPEAQSLRTKVDRLAEQDLTSPATRPDLGKLNFEAIIPLLGFTSDVLRSLQRTDTAKIPSGRINNLNATLDKLNETVIRIKSFDLAKQNVSDRDAIVAAFRDQYNTLFNSAAIPFAIDARADLDPDKITRLVVENLGSTLPELNNQAQDMLARMQNTSKNAETIIASLEAIAARAGVSRHAQVFKLQADEHKTASRVWIGLTIASLAAVVLWGFAAIKIFTIPTNASAAEIAQEIVTRIIVFTGLSYALVWCARNYSANRHNYVMNKHRQNSLTTFEAFVGAAEADADTKNAVLLQATTCIFSPQNTGYGGKETEVDQPSKILEIFKSVKN